MEGKNIVFVGISCDHVEWRWTGALGMMKGIQWWIAGDESFLKAFRADRIPRFILLDRKGRVLELEMTRPSNAKTLDRLLKLKGSEEYTLKRKWQKLPYPYRGATCRVLPWN